MLSCAVLLEQLSKDFCTILLRKATLYIKLVIQLVVYPKKLKGTVQDLKEVKTDIQNEKLNDLKVKINGSGFYGDIVAAISEIILQMHCGKLFWENFRMKAMHWELL